MIAHEYIRLKKITYVKYVHVYYICKCLSRSLNLHLLRILLSEYALW